ncbi:MAG: inositol monophosphatase family protein [Gammaproteobacteria bacterium]|nr:inositol monophosphatase family protein [Gammaproteobacteria bacterium]
MSFDFTKNDLEHLQNIVKQAAIEELLPGFGKREFTYKDDDSIITSADLAMQKRMDAELKQAWPQFLLLGEEMADEEQQAIIDSGDTYWCLDPLDGTNNYAAGLPMFAVSIALIQNGESVLGLIYDPTRDEMFSAIKGAGAFLNGEKLKVMTSTNHAQRIVAEIEMKRLPKELAVRLIMEQPHGSQRNSGSSAIDWCWLSAGRYDLYLHGGQKLWDYAAGHLIFSEVGGKSVSLDGQPVFRGRLETRSVFAAQDAALFDDWYKWIGVPYS